MADRADKETARFKRTLLSLADVRLRVDWLDGQVQSEPPDTLAALLDVVIGQSEVSEPKAREVLVTIALWAAGVARPQDLDRLRQAAYEQRLLSLQRVIRRVPTPSSPAGAPMRRTRRARSARVSRLTNGSRSSAVSG